MKTLSRGKACLLFILCIVICFAMQCCGHTTQQNAQPQQEEAYLIGRVIGVHIIETKNKIYVRDHDALSFHRTSENEELREGEMAIGRRSICEATILVNGEYYTSVYYDDVLRIIEGDILSIPEEAISYDSKTIESAAIRSFARSK